MIEIERSELWERGEGMKLNHEPIRKDVLVERFQHRKDGIIDEQYMNKYAIFLPIIDKKEEGLHLLFEVRAKHMKRQPGEICFPGGKIDPSDPSPAHAAVRELCEEIGVKKEDTTLVGHLDKFVSPFHQIIYPYVGLLDENASLYPNRDEVEEIFTVPLSYFVETKPKRYDVHLKVEPENNFPYEWIPHGKNYPWRQTAMPEYFYFYQDYVIWGLTARIIRHFVEEL